MIKYIKIVSYMSGDSNSHNCVTMGDIKSLLSYFDIRDNNEINNVVFVPNDYFI